MGLTRRSFLGLGAGGLAVLALGGLGLALQPTVARAPAGPLKVLTPRAFSVLAALADRLCPSSDGFPLASELAVAESVDALLSTLPPATGAELEQALLLFDNALTGLLFDGRPATFSAADAATQDAVIAAWRDSGLLLRRKVYKGLRGLVVATYHANPATFAAAGYPGPPTLTAPIAAGELEEGAPAVPVHPGSAP